MIRPNKRALLALALSTCTLPAVAQPPQVVGQGGQVTGGTAAVGYQTPAAGGAAQAIGPANPLATNRVAVPYGETPVAMTAGTWKTVYAGSVTTQKVILGDPSSLGCRFSMATSPAATQGIPFSTTSSPGSQEFADPPPSNAIQALCANSGNITVEAY